MSKEDALYTKTHEYALVEGDVATIGISEFAVQHLSDLVFIDLPDVGNEIAAEEQFGEIESVKAVGELASPVSGEIIEVNEPLEDDLSVLAEDPMEAGWIIKVKMSDPSETENLMDYAAYTKFLEEEER